MKYMLRLFSTRVMAVTPSIIPQVDIDPKGVFKYILIKLTSITSSDSVTTQVVRGYEDCPYHSDINDKFTEQLQQLKQEGQIKDWKTKVLGGGRICHDPGNKTLNVYGYSQGYGKADHQVTVNILRKSYPDYSITYSDEGY